MEFILHLSEHIENRLKSLPNPNKYVTELLKESFNETDKGKNTILSSKKGGKSWAEGKMFGMWKDRDDMKDVEQYLRKSRRSKF